MRTNWWTKAAPVKLKEKTKPASALQSTVMRDVTIVTPHYCARGRALASSSCPRPPLLVASQTSLSHTDKMADMDVDTQESKPEFGQMAFQQASHHSSSSTQPNTDTRWNKDTGAPSCMMLHSEWIQNMRPCCVRIELTNRSEVLATGVGSIWG